MVDMNYKLKSDYGIIFLTYLTKYNIKLISRILFELKEFSIDEFSKAILSHELLKSFEFSPNIHIAIEETALCIQKLNYFKIKTESIFSKNYPAKLKLIADPPPILYYKGSPLRKKKLVAIVGTRDATNIANQIISLLVEIFNRFDFGIVSGLALGIDSMAHRNAIDKKTYTVAVMAGALNDIYPKENFALANEIIDSGGTLISELPFGISHGKRSFVMRNRIQAGISDYVMPIEMGIKSGTMTTVEFAYAQGKYIFLIPPTESFKNRPQYEGINYFIQKSVEEKYKRTYKITDLTDLESFLKNQPYQRDLFNV
jgi:DNA protecting protein DprA